MQKGVNAYLFGSYNYKQDNTRMYVTNVALTTNVATINVQITVGEIPIVGALLTISQTGSTGGAFNVNRAPITAVSINALGVGTISYALVRSNVGSAPDAGSAIAEVPEIGDVAANGASIACCMAAPDSDSQATVTAAVTFPSLPTAATVVLQQALKNIDAEFTTILPTGGGTAATVAAGVQTVGPVASYTLTRGNFYRFLVSGVSGGTLPTIVGKLV